MKLGDVKAQARGRAPRGGGKIAVKHVIDLEAVVESLGHARTPGKFPGMYLTIGEIVTIPNMCSLSQKSVQD